LQHQGSTSKVVYEIGAATNFPQTAKSVNYKGMPQVSATQAEFLAIILQRFKSVGTDLKMLTTPNGIMAFSYLNVDDVNLLMIL